MPPVIPMYIEHVTVTAGPGAVHVERAGLGGPVVLLVHGAGTCSWLWRHVVPPLASSGCTVIAVDLPGHGASTRPPGLAGTPTVQAEALERVLAALRLPHAVVVAHGEGAFAALLLAARWPHRVERLALLGPPDPCEAPSPAVRLLQRAAARRVLGSPSLFGAAPVLAALLDAGVKDRHSLPELVRLRYAAPFVGTDGTEALLRLANECACAEEELEAFALVRSEVLLVRGEDDALSRPADGDALARLLPNATVRRASIPDAGHLLPEDAPAALLATLQPWLAAP